MTSTCSQSAPSAACADSARRAKSAESRLGAIWQATLSSLEGAAGSVRAHGVAGQGDAAPERLGFEQPQPRDLDALGEQRLAASLHRRVDEQPVLVDEARGDHRVAEPDATGEHDVLAGLLLK